MFEYPRRDKVFDDRVASYLRAGLDVGEMCLYVASVSADPVIERLYDMGVDARHAVKTGQLAVHRFGDTYMPDGILDTARLNGFWSDRVRSAGKWRGLRIFGDTTGLEASRTLRLKMLEYESLVNADKSGLSLVLCGYESSTTLRSLLVQMKSVHPFLASTRSIRTNQRYLDPRRFLGMFYRFRRTSGTYTACARSITECCRRFEELAARTPMSMPELESMKLAVSEAFSNALKHGCPGLPADRCHIHVCFLSEPTGFTVEIRDHGPGFALSAESRAQLEPQGRGIELMSSLVSALDIRRRRDDTVVTLRIQYAAPFDL